uniref:Uncharacterized protein n=2 Tax=unclassified Caudoviricetes TaxID=2788787 RepID=A0AB39AC49_9CAUD
MSNETIFMIGAIVILLAVAISAAHAITEWIFEHD